MRSAVLLALALSPALAHAQTRVHVVDPGGGGDFDTLAAAFAAASDGDVVLVRAGDYFASAQGLFLPANKGLSIVAEAGSYVRAAPFTLDGLQASQHVLVQGIRMETLGGQRDVVRATAGPVWFERCVFVHTAGGVASEGGVAVEGAASAVFTASELGPPVSLLTNNGLALSLFAARVHLHASTVLGLDEKVPAVQGLQSSFLEVLGGEVRGAPGLSGNSFHCNGFDGGSGLLLRNTSRVLTLGATIAGGLGGAPFAGSGCSPGDDGFDSLLLSGSTRDARAGEAKRLELSSPVRDDELVNVAVHGRPGDRVWIVFASRPMPGQSASARDGELLIGAPRQTVPLGTIPSGGTLALQTAAPTLPAGTEGTVFFSQALVKDAVTGRFVVSSPSALVVLDDSL